jgi:predicted Fe-Mo cluster-binding NifX family protein
MKIAVPTRQDKTVDSHFGHCEFFTVFTISDDKQITGTEIVSSPQECGCKSNIAEVLHNQGVSVMLAGNIGGGAINVLSGWGIAVVRGCDGNVTDVVNAFLRGEVMDSGVTCEHHDHHNNN